MPICSCANFVLTKYSVSLMPRLNNILIKKAVESLPLIVSNNLCQSGEEGGKKWLLMAATFAIVIAATTGNSQFCIAHFCIPTLLQPAERLDSTMANYAC